MKIPVFEHQQSFTYPEVCVTGKKKNSSLEVILQGILDNYLI